jgi:hypothetical protein
VLALELEELDELEEVATELDAASEVDAASELDAPPPGPLDVALSEAASPPWPAALAEEESIGAPPAPPMPLVLLPCAALAMGARVPVDQGPSVPSPSPPAPRIPAVSFVPVAHETTTPVAMRTRIGIEGRREWSKAIEAYYAEIAPIRDCAIAD